MLAEPLNDWRHAAYITPIAGSCCSLNDVAHQRGDRPVRWNQGWAPMVYEAFFPTKGGKSKARIAQGKAVSSCCRCTRQTNGASGMSGNPARAAKKPATQAATWVNRAGYVPALDRLRRQGWAGKSPGRELGLTNKPNSNQQKELYYCQCRGYHYIIPISQASTILFCTCPRSQPTTAKPHQASPLLPDTRQEMVQDRQQSCANSRHHHHALQRTIQSPPWSDVKLRFELKQGQSVFPPKVAASGNWINPR